MSDFEVPAIETMVMGFVNGPSKSGKSTVASAMTDALQCEGYNACEADAGLFFRTVTDRAFAELGITSPDCAPPLDELTDAVDRVVSDQSVFDPREACVNPEAPIIAQNVSTVGGLKVAQAAGLEWYERTAQACLDRGTEVLVINGRDPRQRLQSWMRQRGVLSAFDVLVECEAYEAGRRALRSKGSPGSHRSIEEEAVRIEDRRIKDLLREVFPFEGAMGDTVVLDPRSHGEDLDWAAHAATLRAWTAEGDRPSTILLDTTNMALSDARAAAGALAIYGLRTYTARELCTSAYS